MRDQMTFAQFSDLFDRVSNWGRWGEQDERGTVNFIGPDELRRALALGREGVAVGLGRVLATAAGPSNIRPVIHTLYPVVQFEDVPGGDSGGLSEFIGMRVHGPVVTHIDAHSHSYHRGQIYGGRPRPEFGRLPRHGTIMAYSSGILARGVLVDVPFALGLDRLDPGDIVTRGELESALEKQATELKPGDAVLVRTGRDLLAERWAIRDDGRPLPPPMAGLHPSTMLMFFEHQTALLGGDNFTDAEPSLVPELVAPAHALSLVSMGMPLVDNLWLEPLSEECRRRRRWDFLLILAPLQIVGGTSSPVNPIAVF